MDKQMMLQAIDDMRDRQIERLVMAREDAREEIDRKFDEDLRNLDALCERLKGES